jgi:tRNA threonylcarbamoyl adenosine modification protein (Sua5/YciO/YrdC/YwlC family)
MAIGRGNVVCVPTDTVYGLVADAFKPSATKALRDARGMGERDPLAVLLPGIPTLRALAENVPDEVQALAQEFWPGALTIITAAGESLMWDLGDTQGTVALRMPSERVVLELLSETGPLVASSAYRVGETGGLSAEDAEATFGNDVAVYLSSGGSYSPGVLSTILDATGLDKPGGKLRLVREGAIAATDIYAVVDVSRFG